MLMVIVALHFQLMTYATGGLNVNTTADEPTVLPCTVENATSPSHLRFYWQDERKRVLYSFNRGSEMPEHVDELYRDRVSAFPQDMSTGNVSVLLKHPTLEDNGRVFELFALFDSTRPLKFSLQHPPLCQHALHVAVSYKGVTVALNKTAGTAVCTVQGGYPEASLKWRLQYRSNSSKHFVHPRDVYTVVLQDRANHAYSISSTIKIPAGQYVTVECLVHNPTLNKTLSATKALNKGEAVTTLPVLGLVLMAAAVSRV